MVETFQELRLTGKNTTNILLGIGVSLSTSSKPLSHGWFKSTVRYYQSFNFSRVSKDWLAFLRLDIKYLIDANRSFQDIYKDAKKFEIKILVNADDTIYELTETGLEPYSENCRQQIRSDR
jgi:hypothetical protein